MRTRVAVMLILTACMVSAQGQLKSRDQRYRLNTADILDVKFRFSPEFNQEVTVGPDGYISLQIAGEVKVGGLTVTEATAAIVNQCAHILREPEVMIALKDFAKPVFYVGGNVVKPGRFDLRGSISVSDAISTAGGMVPGSNDTDVLLFRRVSADMVEVKRIDLKRAIEKDSMREDVTLEPNDSIYISRSKIGKFERFMQITHLGMYFDPLPFSFK